MADVQNSKKPIKKMTPEEYKEYKNKAYYKWYHGGGAKVVLEKSEKKTVLNKIRYLEARGYIVSRPL